jgi:hypothetical protein
MRMLLISSAVVALWAACATLPAAVDGTAKAMDWPGTDDVQNADKKDEFGVDLSGLYYVYKDTADIETDTMYAIKNSPSTLYKLYYDTSSSNWKPVKGIFPR